MRRLHLGSLILICGALSGCGLHAIAEDPQPTKTNPPQAQSSSPRIPTACLASAGLPDEEMRNFLEVKGIDFMCAKKKAVAYTMKKYSCTPPAGMSPAIDREIRGDVGRNCRIADLEKRRAIHTEDETQ